MSNIYVELENCYGIQNFKYTFEFDADRNKAYLIYASNGVMKTSFANTIKDICDGNDSKDCFYPTRKTSRTVKKDNSSGTDLLANEIMVIEPYAEQYKSDNVNILLANEDLKIEYETIHKEINKRMKDVISSLNSFSGKRNSEEILATDFDYSPDNYLECLEKIYTENSEAERIDYSTFKYKDLFNSDSEKILTQDVVIRELDLYMQEYKRLVSESKIFRDCFNHNNAEEVLKSLVKEGFFTADHKIMLADSDTSISEDEFKMIIMNEKNRILNSELVEKFNKIDELISPNAGGKALRNLIFENKDIIPELVDSKSFKQKIWISYLFKKEPEFKDAILNYRSNIKRLEEIASKANEDESKWNEVVLQFNERFSNMPFRLQIENRNDVVLKSKLPSISFMYKDRDQETRVQESDLLLHLSSGEKKALYLLNIIFEIQARIELGIPTFLIIDDIADSFDYRNKYAIIEYIKDIVDTELLMPIILTHNFDFYRTVAGRVGIKPTSKFVLKSGEEIILEQGQYFENVFNCWRTSVYDNDEVFISSIAFIRNLAEYRNGSDCDTYLNLTSLLHYKKFAIGGAMATADIKNSDLIKWYGDEWGRETANFKQDPTQRAIDLILETADNIEKNPVNTIEIEKKIAMSIAIRLKAEIYMIDRINDDSKVGAIPGNQTRGLKDLILFDKADTSDIKRREIIERVLITTSENIHINSFMYEPIVDMALEELVKLYRDINENLNN